MAAPTLPSDVFYQLGTVVEDQHLSEPVWPLMVAALRAESVHTALASAPPLATRYGGNGDHPEVVEALLDALQGAATANHMAVTLLALLLGWPEDNRDGGRRGCPPAAGGGAAVGRAGGHVGRPARSG